MSVDFVCQEINKKGLKASKEWINECVKWCKCELKITSPQQIVQTVYEQWLNTDIRTEGVQSSAQLKQLDPAQKTAPSLCSSYTLQVLKAVDIGKDSAFTQLQNALKLGNENHSVSADGDSNRHFHAAWEPKSRRMLKLRLSDGFCEVDAIEHEVIPQLVYPTPVGLKVQLKGPIDVRRGMLLMTPKVVQVLGGVVEELRSEGGLIAQLCETLNVPEQIRTQWQQKYGQQHERSQLRRSETADVFADGEDDLFLTIPIPSTSRSDRMDFPDNPDEEALLLSVDVEGNQASTLLAGSGIDDLMTNDEEEEALFAAVQIPQGPVNFDAKPYHYLSLIMASVPFDGEVVVKGCIVSLCSKLSIRDQIGGRKTWYIQILVTDGTANIKASLGHDLILEWLQLDPKEYEPQRHRALVAQNSQKCSQKLQTFNGLLRLRFSRAADEPELVQMSSLNRGHVQQLKNRMARGEIPLTA